MATDGTLKQRIVWIHGIGRHSPGYSDAWERSFNAYLNLPHAAYLEVEWDSVLTPPPGARALPAAAGALPLTEQERLAEAEVRAELETILLARATALAQTTPVARARGQDDRVVEWSEIAAATRAPVGARGLLPDWLAHPDAYLGDFTKYLVSGRVRTAVKERAKEPLRSLAGGAARVAIIAHSWGTVVAYDSLLDLEVELPALRDVVLITLGSPLWLVRRLLEDRSGRKPGQAATWINIHARGDPVGSWLSAGFRVDREYEVPNVGGGDPHGSYFRAGNEAVQRDVIAAAILS